ncbi:ATP-binding protein [Streptomyces sp. NPDC020801]|uniref:ATP-binding protein n=1 Tax=unclassified Streptomyces TaxID=2593676 RepID=UPI003790A5DA
MNHPSKAPSARGAAPPPHTEHICPLPRAPEAVRTVRRSAREVLAHWALPAETADDAVLVITELITNAITHARPPAELRLSMPGGGGRRALRIEVTDAGPVPRHRPSPGGPHPAVWEESGRGTGIIAALSIRHGTSHRPRGSTRWADLRVPR